MFYCVLQLGYAQFCNGFIISSMGNELSTGYCGIVSNRAEQNEFFSTVRQLDILHQTWRGKVAKFAPSQIHNKFLFIFISLSSDSCGGNVPKFYPGKQLRSGTFPKFIQHEFGHLTS